MKSEEDDRTLIARFGTRNGTLRVEAHVYGIDVQISDEAVCGLTVEQAETLRDRLNQALEAIANADATKPYGGTDDPVS